jgi:hypothetical protein
MLIYDELFQALAVQARAEYLIQAAFVVAVDARLYTFYLQRFGHRFSLIS